MTVDLTAARRLAAADHGLAVVAIATGDGSVHASVVNAGVLADPVTDEPAVAFVAGGTAVKLRHLRRVGRATIVFRAGWEWVAIEGPVRLIGPDDDAAGFPPDGLPRLLRDIFTAAGGTHDDWAEFDRVMAAERRVAVFVAAGRVTSTTR